MTGLKQTDLTPERLSHGSMRSGWGGLEKGSSKELPLLPVPPAGRCARRWHTASGFSSLHITMQSMISGLPKQLRIGND